MFKTNTKQFAKQSLGLLALTILAPSPNVVFFRCIDRQFAIVSESSWLKTIYWYSLPRCDLHCNVLIMSLDYIIWNGPIYWASITPLTRSTQNRAYQTSHYNQPETFPLLIYHYWINSYRLEPTIQIQCQETISFATCIVILLFGYRMHSVSNYAVYKENMSAGTDIVTIKD